MSAIAARGRPLFVTREGLMRAVLAVMIAVGCIAMIEPSPYEYLFFLFVPLAAFTGLTLTRTTLALLYILVGLAVPLMIALVPYFGEHVRREVLSPVTYTGTTLYLYFSCLLFALLFSRQTLGRLRVALLAYCLSSVVAGLVGALTLFNVAGLAQLEAIPGRVAGTFKDPNVLGSYCLMGALYLMHSLVTRRGHGLFKLACLAIVLLGGIFAPFSRGTWGAFVFATLYLGVSLAATEKTRAVRLRLAFAASGLAVLLFIGALIVALNPDLSAMFVDRISLAHDYDVGETGRFGNQLRSIPMLIARPLGFGPYRFPLYFGLQPHNSYIGAFADAGWASGLMFFILAAWTSWLATRQAFTRSALTPYAQVVAPAVVSFFLQGFQIDIDHWRWVYLMVGAVWGMESALRAGPGPLDAVSPSRRSRLDIERTGAPAALPSGLKTQGS